MELIFLSCSGVVPTRTIVTESIVDVRAVQCTEYIWSMSRIDCPGVNLIHNNVPCTLHSVQLRSILPRELCLTVFGLHSSGFTSHESHHTIEFNDGKVSNNRGLNIKWLE